LVHCSPHPDNSAHSASRLGVGVATCIHKHPDLQSREAADLVLKQNYSYIEASRSLGVGESALRRWVDQVQQERQGVTP